MTNTIKSNTGHWTEVQPSIFGEKEGDCVVWVPNWVNMSLEYFTDSSHVVVNISERSKNKKVHLGKPFNFVSRQPNLGHAVVL